MARSAKLIHKSSNTEIFSNERLTANFLKNFAFKHSPEDTCCIRCRNITLVVIATIVVLFVLGFFYLLIIPFALSLILLCMLTAIMVFSGCDLGIQVNCSFNSKGNDSNSSNRFVSETTVNLEA